MISEEQIFLILPRIQEGLLGFLKGHGGDVKLPDDLEMIFLSATPIQPNQMIVEEEKIPDFSKESGTFLLASLKDMEKTENFLMIQELHFLYVHKI